MADGVLTDGNRTVQDWLAIQRLECEWMEMENQIRAITGRSRGVAARGLYRMHVISQRHRLSHRQVFEHWKWRQLQGWSWAFALKRPVQEVDKALGPSSDAMLRGISAATKR